MYDDYEMDFGRKKRVGRPRGRGMRKSVRGKSVIIRGRKRKVYRGKTGALYYRSRSGKVYLSARRMRMKRGLRGRKSARRVRRGRSGRRLKMTKSAIAGRRAYRRRKARMSFFGSY
jgi:hypothetical protein